MRTCRSLLHQRNGHQRIQSGNQRRITVERTICSTTGAQLGGPRSGGMLQSPSICGISSASKWWLVGNSWTMSLGKCAPEAPCVLSTVFPSNKTSIQPCVCSTGQTPPTAAPSRQAICPKVAQASFSRQPVSSTWTSQALCKHTHSPPALPSRLEAVNSSTKRHARLGRSLLTELTSISTLM